MSRGALVLMSLLVGLPGFTPAAAEAPDPLLRKLQARLEALESLRGRFVQSLEARALGRPRTERGSFAIKKPSRMRWEYEEPEKKVALSDGATTWLYIPEDGEVYRGKTGGPERGGSAMHLLTGRARLDRDFVSRRLSPEEAGPQGVVGADVIELVPREPSTEFERLVLAVDPALVTIRRMTIVDPLGDKMVFDFFDIVENVHLADEMFQFEIPPGVEVIDQQ